MTEQEHTAWHEAGHAVVGILHGVEVNWATIDKDACAPGAVGHTAHQGHPDPLVEAMMAMAGMGAAQLAGVPAKLARLGAAHDAAAIEESVFRIPVEERCQIGPALHGMLTDNWAAVERVRDALLANQTVGRTELVRLVRGSEA